VAYPSKIDSPDEIKEVPGNGGIGPASPARIQPRIERAAKAFEEGDLQFASEILGELKAAGHSDPGIDSLEQRIAHSQKQKDIGQLLESARVRFDQQEYPLSLQKIARLLELDPGNAEALELKASVESRMTAVKIEEWLGLARQHLDNQAWSRAREALGKVLELQANEPRAVQLLAAVERLEQEYVRVRKEQEELHNLALEAWNSGEVSTALGRMEKVLEIGRKTPERAAPERAGLYQAFYDQVRSQDESIRNSYAEAKKCLEGRDFTQALAIANEWLGRYPGHALFQSLKFDVGERERQELSARIVEIDRQVDAEPCLDRRVSILEQAAAQYPGEAHFERQLGPMRERRDLVNSIAAKARCYEEQEQFGEALAQWEILGTIYSQYPGLSLEVELVTKKEDQRARKIDPGDVPAPVAAAAPDPAPLTWMAEAPQLAVLPDSTLPDPAPPAQLDVTIEAPPLAVPPDSTLPDPAPPAPLDVTIEAPLSAAHAPVAAALRHSLKLDQVPGALWVCFGAAAALMLLSAALFVEKNLGNPVPRSEAGVQVEVRTSPPGATIRVNGKIRGTSNFRLEDVPGKYRIEASLDGYRPASTTADLRRGAAGPIALTLLPLPQTVRLITDLSDGRVFLDSLPQRNLQDGQVIFDAVAPGRHSLKLAGRDGAAQFAFELLPGGLPVLGGPPAANNVAGLVVSSFSNRARVYATLPAARVELDGAPVGEIGPEGLRIDNVAPGAHQLSVAGGKTRLKKVIETGAAPMLMAFFQSDRDIGTIVVLAGEEGAEVRIDGKSYRSQTGPGGQLRIQRAPSEYRIQVVKPGFEDAPEQVVRIAKGEEVKVGFQLVPRPTTAHLSIRGTPGAQVFVDQNDAGAVPPEGTFEVSNLSPGEHVIELRKEKLRSQLVRRAFTAGQTVHLADGDVALRGAAGTLKLTVSPAGAAITAARAGEAPQPVASGALELAEGSYTVTAHAPGYGDRSERVQIVGGQAASLNLVLAREQKAVTAAGMEGWQNSAWTREGEWYVHRGAGLLLYRAPGKPGSYGFNVVLSAGGGVLRGKAIEWVVGYTDERNYVLYRLEKDDLRCFHVANGKRIELPRKPHGLKLKEVMASVQLEVEPNAITTRFRNRDKWETVATWTAPGNNFAGSRFGFRVEGKDEVRLSGFGFYPKE
jgi:tetratricopeptide (TPR) repeat protein